MQEKTQRLFTLLQSQPVIPVIQITDLSHAIPLARALVKGGLPAIEITLRTPIALDAIEIIAKNVTSALIGAGTVLTPQQYTQAQKAGAQFLVSPGLTQALIEVDKTSSIPLLPGAITPSEMMQAADHGYQYLKFFPAQAAGGINFLKSLAAPLAHLKFCPTSGISEDTAPQWLALPNVLCVGGSWVAPDSLIKTQDWSMITQFAKQAYTLRSAKPPLRRA
ncbi:bifunctional 4-hydroxy-2-oxoglutarate aldolase/2-dehydro-3-deoxy-phosphogluconate aldolase [Bartonella sp. DGB2]|uniref:bifunctional 4-hydroxy-2-oxoglutarate aldolase/2-dehydro-3-deoxy-phosphogluconate aldolase n=1 Tax=Bartonella sp. DGB2 TaxID=3388426 RepID=UPI00398FB0FB